MTHRVHIVGAGLAGVSCAAFLRHKGVDVILYEATPKPGGRIRKINGDISHDNGTHLIVGAYRTLFEYLDLINASKNLIAYEPVQYEMYEGETSWTIKAESFLKQVMSGAIPGINLLNLFGERSRKRFWNPLSLAIFNTPFKDVPYGLLLSTALELLKSGPGAMIPYFTGHTLVDDLIAPGLVGVDVNTGWRLKGLERSRLVFTKGDVLLGNRDCVVLALPFQSYQHLDMPYEIPILKPSAITNIHYFPEVPVENRFFGLVGTQAQWVYARQNHICVTLSHSDEVTVELVNNVWAEISKFFPNCRNGQPRSRVICEKSATPFQDKNFVRLRSGVKTPLQRVFLAGDWVNTGLPATLESAVRSGKAAAQQCLKNLF